MKKSSYLLPAVIITFSAALLIGARFHATFAGGDGMLFHKSATLSGIIDSTAGTPLPFTPETVVRGESMKTGAHEWKRYTLSPGTNPLTVSLDENTEIKIISSNGTVPTFEIVSGKAVIHGQVTVNVRNTHVHSNGTSSFTFYSWLDVLDVSQIEGTIDVIENDVPTPVPAKSFRLDTLAPYDPATPFPFNPSTSSSASFYEWALN